MIATYGSEESGSEKRLCRSSDSCYRSFLFKTSNDLMTLVLSYLDIESICHIDIAVSNATERHQIIARFEQKRSVTRIRAAT